MSTVQRNGDGVVPLRTMRIPLVTVSPLFAAREPTAELRFDFNHFSSLRATSCQRGARSGRGRGTREAYNNDIAIIALPIKISPDKASTRGFVSRTADKTTDAIASNIVGESHSTRFIITLEKLEDSRVGTR